MESRPLYIPVILGTTRMGRMSAHVARLLREEVSKQAGVETDLIDIAGLPLPTNDAGEAIKEGAFSAKMDRADGLVIVAPEYNHGYSGLLKHVLDSCLKEYIHKAVGIVGVSAGPFGGTRVIQNLLPVMRELGLVTIFWDVNFSTVQNSFDGNGKLLDPSYVRRVDKFLKELIWMSRTLRYGRENVPV
ncbi:MAG: NADPH-dependent FMN reductase [Acidobacteria bacterium]|nr:MAG: NADPH-dependent FMN reductase [Acidobacteriota bacterium]